MINPTEQAEILLNRSLKLCVYLEKDMKLQEAKEIALLQLMSIKEALYNVSLFDSHICKKTLAYYQEVKNEIESINLKLKNL